jgi:hypothetical protein
VSPRRRDDQTSDLDIHTESRAATFAIPGEPPTRAGGGTVLRRAGRTHRTPTPGRSRDPLGRRAFDIVLEACTAIDREGAAAQDSFALQFARLPQDEQAAVVRLLVRVILGDAYRLAWYTRHATELLAAASLDGAGPLIRPHLADLEAAFNDADNRASFLAAPDSKVSPRGDAFRRNWRYPLLLWVVLRQGGSRDCDSTFDLLASHARAGQLRQALNAYRRLLDGFARQQAS